MAIPNTKIIQKGRQKMKKIAIIWLVLSPGDVLWGRDSYNINI